MILLIGNGALPALGSTRVSRFVDTAATEEE
jgi:hypothetical protein